MKRRYRYSLNILSFGLLLFALYLNFVKKDPVDASTAPDNNQGRIGSSKEGTKPSALHQAAQTFSLR